MPASPSPTSSSEIGRTIRSAIPVWLIALVLVGIAELGARTVLGDDPSWRMWTRTSAAKLRILQRAHAENRPPDLLILGDSSAAFNLMPSEIDDVLDTRSYNFGMPGNYPRSFDVVMTDGLLQELPIPERVIVSFADASFDPARNGQTQAVLASPLALQTRGERVWAEHLWLVRMHHWMRLTREPPVTPTVFRNRGFEPYETALLRRRRQPRLAAALPAPPDFLEPFERTSVPPTIAELEPLRRLFDHLIAEGASVVMVSPPSDTRVLQPEIAALCAELGVQFIDLSAARIPQHNSHLHSSDARVYSRRIAERMR